MRNHSLSVRDAVRLRHGLGRRGLFACILAVALLAVAGCGLDAQPVSGDEVSPVQLRPRAKAVAQADAAETVIEQPEPTPPPRWQEPTVPAQATDAAEDQTAVPQPEQAQPLIQQTTAPPPIEVQVETPPVETAIEAVPTPPPAPPAIPAPQVRMPALEEPGMADQPVSVNFEDADIRTVLKTIGLVTGINFIFHQEVAGKVSVVSPTPIRAGDIYGFLQSILDVYGYAAVESENAVKIVPKANAARNSTQVRIGADPARIPLNDAIVTQIVPLQYADATEVSEIIRPNVAGQIVVYPRTNSIMITDTSANIHHLCQIVRQFDAEGSREKHETIPLQFASAQVLCEQITRILERADTITPQGVRPRGAAPGQGARVLPDERTNAVIAVANEQDMETIKQLVRQLDVPRPTGTDDVQVAHLKNADANEVAASLRSALSGLAGVFDATQPIQVTAHSSTNSLIIVASPQDYELIAQIIEKLDIVREQVLVQALIVEVTEEALQQIGVDWATLDDVVANSVRGFGLTNFGPRVDFLNGNLEGLAVGAWKGTSSDVRIAFILQALETHSGVNILSRPTVMTTNHRKASIVVGESRAFIQSSRVTETTDPATPTVIQGFEYRDVGITLEVTPHVSQGGQVRLEVNSEFSKLIEDVAASSLNTPVTAKRSADTVVSMKSGTTVVIGGLMRDDTTNVTQQVPILGDLPLVGSVFRTQRERKQKTNLLIFITPTIMANDEQLIDATNRMQQEMDAAREPGK